MVSPTKKILLTTLLTNACRVLLAILFMVSGFVKAVDPIGFFYKLKEYAAVFDVTFFSDAWLLFFALVIVGAEFVAGFFLLTGIYRKPVAILSFFALLFYTLLTLYLWVENPVADCGCFGDALQLTNQETFVKNLFLLLMAIVVCFNTSYYRHCISSNTRWIAVVFAIAYTVLIEGMSMQHLPVIDFRPFAIGTDLRTAIVGEPARYLTFAVYEKDGELYDFPDDSVPTGDGWTYFGHRDRVVSHGRPAAIDNFSFIDLATDYDVAEDIIADTAYVALLVLESVENADESRVDRINDLYDYCKEHKLSFYAATSSSEDAVALWRKRTGAEYPLYWADNDMLKTMIRANPGLVLIKDGVVIEKWDIDDVPVVDTMSEQGSLLGKDYVKTMRGWRFWLLLFVLPMAFILFVDMIAAPRKKKKQAASAVEEKTSDINNINP